MPSPYDYATSTGYLRTRADWVDFPSTSTPITQAQLDQIDQAIFDLKGKGTFLNVKDFGAKGDDSTDDKVAIQNTIAQLDADGGTIYFPFGIYRCSGQISVDGKRSVRFVGEGGLSAGAAQASVLKFTFTGATTALSARSTTGFGIQDMAVIYTSTSFTGTLIDCSLVTTNTSALSLNRCYFGGGSTAHTAAEILLLNKVISSSIRDCVFSGAVQAVRGRVSNADFSNAICFDSCYFDQMNTIAVRNAGEAWSFRNCTFEALISGNAGAYISDGGITVIRGFSFRDCWFGDANASGDWISFWGQGLNLHGCRFGNGLYALRLSNSNTTDGVSITGCTFDTMTAAVRLDGAVKNFEYVGNFTTGVTTEFSYGGTCVIPSVASATALTIPGGARAITVTGTTTITSVTAGYPGQVTTLIFTGILTFTDGSNLKLAGNFVTTADDAITIVYDGANWYEASRSVN